MSSENLESEKRSILVVDDQPKNLQVIATVLSKDYNLFIANHPEKAIKIAEEKLPDLILLDVMMPDMNGFQVCEILKKNKDTKNIPIIFLTAKTETEDIVEGFRVGGVDYVTKPFRKEEVISRIKTHIDLKISKELIEKQNEELIQTNAEKDKFFSIIAHDLKGPFNGFMGLSDLLANDAESLGMEEIIDISKAMNQSSVTLYKLLENLLNWSRLKRGLMEFVPETIQLNLLVENTVMISKEHAFSKNIEIFNQINQDTKIVVDTNMIATVIRNLISNSIKFTKPEGKIFIKVDSENNDFFTICIEDTGIGMSDKIKNKLFRIDEHHSSVGTAKETGTGLGLILCKEFIEKHSCKIWVESEEGVGSKFFFTIPKAKE